MAREDAGDDDDDDDVVALAQQHRCRRCRRCRVVASPLSCSRARENGRARALAGFGE